jgi:hypothetical protein
MDTRLQKKSLDTSRSEAMEILKTQDPYVFSMLCYSAFYAANAAERRELEKGTEKDSKEISKQIQIAIRYALNNHKKRTKLFQYMEEEEYSRFKEVVEQWVDWERHHPDDRLLPTLIPDSALKVLKKTPEQFDQLCHDFIENHEKTLRDVQSKPLPKKMIAAIRKFFAKIWREHVNSYSNAKKYYAKIKYHRFIVLQALAEKISARLLEKNFTTIHRSQELAQLLNERSAKSEPSKKRKRGKSSEDSEESSEKLSPSTHFSPGKKMPFRQCKKGKKVESKEEQIESSESTACSADDEDSTEEKVEEIKLSSKKASSFMQAPQFSPLASCSLFPPKQIQLLPLSLTPPQAADPTIFLKAESDEEEGSSRLVVRGFNF